MKKLYTIILMFLLLVTGCGGPSRPSVLLIVIDTLAADHMSCYGYERETTPSIDSLAGSGTLWSNAQAQAPWTLPSMATILTGLTVRTHGCRQYGDACYGLDPELPTLATILRDEGYRTAAFVNITYLGEDYGLNKDFQHFCYHEEGNGRAGETVDSLLAWMDGDDFGQPFFVFFHLFDPHLPYDPPEGFDRTYEPDGTRNVTRWRQDLTGQWYPRQHLMNLYDGEIRWTDSQIGRLLAEIRQRGLEEDLIVVLCSDHGEEFLEHGDWGHGPNLYQTSIHVPLMMSGPGIASGITDSTTAGQLDILPTLLTLLEIQVPERAEGMDLFGTVPDDRHMYSSGVRCDTAQAAVVSNGMKLIWVAIEDSTETYDIRNDPMETEPLAADSALLESVLQYWAWPCPWEPTTREIDMIERRRLEDLGYIR